MDIYVKQSPVHLDNKVFKKVIKKVLIQVKSGEDEIVDAGVAMSYGWIELQRQQDTGDFQVKINHPDVMPVIGLELETDLEKERREAMRRAGMPESIIKSHRLEF